MYHFIIDLYYIIKNVRVRMIIKSIQIKNILNSGFKNPCEGVRHIKSLPCLSVVQALHGHYELGLNDAPLCATEEGGAFIAPAGAKQTIVHHEGAEGYMEAQWIFMRVIINDLFDFEECFELPLLLSATYRDQLNDLIDSIRNAPDLCSRYAYAYKLVGLLISESKPKEPLHDRTVVLLKKYVNDHYRERISKEMLAEVEFCSVPNLYRIFQRNFGLSPHNYINKIRLEKASVLLEHSDRAVAEIAESVGFEDPIYFSKLFKKTYQRSPQKYRDALSLK